MARVAVVFGLLLSLAALGFGGMLALFVGCWNGCDALRILAGSSLMIPGLLFVIAYVIFARRIWQKAPVSKRLYLVALLGMAPIFIGVLSSLAEVLTGAASPAFAYRIAALSVLALIVHVIVTLQLRRQRQD